jgi:Leucine-rich repeat (LRR) protein
MPHLEKLFLDNNAIETLKPDSFSGLINVHILWLDNNKIQYLHADVFLNLPSIEIFDLRGNQWLKIPNYRPFINSPSLTILYIINCNVSSASVETFANVTGLERLDLKTIDIKIFKKFPKLSTLHFYENPLQCDWRWCQDREVKTGTPYDAPACDTPSEVMELHWEVLEKSQCIHDNITYVRDYKNASYRYNDADNYYTFQEIEYLLKYVRSNACICSGLYIGCSRKCNTRRYHFKQRNANSAQYVHP